MEIFFILGIPVILAAISLFIRNYPPSAYPSSTGKAPGIVNFFGHLVVGLFSLKLVAGIAQNNTPLSFFNFFYVDSLSALFIFTISILNIASALYSIEYIYHEEKEGMISPKKSRTYYVFFNLFTFSMFFVAVLNNMGMAWVAIEMTTLASAFLVGFHNNKTSVEAAWKYVIICSVGIALALFGTILFYYTVYTHGHISSMNWTDMLSVAARLNPNVLKIAFLFILVGYGTKAGLAPMHTWLPDAHSQALSPISALLSGALLPTAIYAILRFVVVINKSIGPEFCGGLLLFFGLLSLGVSAGFVLVQKDIKRLLAYSSIEHVGIICVGLGIGGPLGLYGALLHVFNHAVTKSAMFLGAGNVVRKYGTNDMHKISGVIKSMPFTGAILALGTFALAGSPPFSIFISEIIILLSSFLKGSYLVSALFLIFIAIIFAAMVYHLSKIIFGKKPENMPVEKEPVTGKAAFILLFVFVFIMGLTIIWPVNKILVSAVTILKGA